MTEQIKQSQAYERRHDDKPQYGPFVLSPLVHILRNSWFLIAFIGAAIYWVARQDHSLTNIDKNEARTTALEARVTTLESGNAQLQLKIDGIKEDVRLIKSAVIK